MLVYCWQIPGYHKGLSGTLDIINWMKYNNNRMAIEKKPMNIYSLVADVCNIFIPIAEKKNITIHNNVSSSTYANIDSNIFSIILNNLISNAVKYSDEGEITISAETGIDTAIILSISDTGRGINESKLAVIQSLINGHKQNISTTSSGTGLGYILISELVRIHQLQIIVESQVNKGTTVSIQINS